MLVVQGSLNVIDSGIRHTATIEYIEPFLRGLLNSGAFNHTIDIRSVLYSVTVSDKAGVCLPIGEAQSITQHAKKSIIATAEENVSVKSLVASVGYNGCWEMSVSLLCHKGPVVAYGAPCPNGLSPFCR